MCKFNLDFPRAVGMQVNIDPENFKITNLAEDIKKQSSYFQYYGKLAIGAKHDAAMAELRIKQAIAEKKLEIRSSCGDKKLTEATLDAMIEVDPIIAKMKEELIDMEAASDLLDNARRAMDHKRSMIDAETRLEVSGAYNSKDADDAIADAVRLSIRNKNVNEH